MAYFSLHAYDADVRIPEFRGLMQGGDEIDADVRYAVEEKNLETLDGVLQPQAPATFLNGEFDHPVETLMWFFRRWYSGHGGNSWFIAAVDGQLYFRPEKDIDYWDQIVLPAGTASFSKNVWSYTTYETNASGTSDVPVDVLIISNNVDGMYMITPPDRLNNWNDLKQQTWGYWKEKSWIRTLTD